jgi:hypothetical protein
MKLVRFPVVLVLSSSPAFSQVDALQNLKWRNIGPAT